MPNTSDVLAPCRMQLPHANFPELVPNKFRKVYFANVNFSFLGRGFPFLSSGCYFGLVFQLRLGASDCPSGLAFCFMGPWTFGWICCSQLPYHPVKNRMHSTSFTAQGGTHRLWGSSSSGL